PKAAQSQTAMPRNAPKTFSEHGSVANPIERFSAWQKHNTHHEDTGKKMTKKFGPLIIITVR
ncbi:hypothetical protein, partial [Paramuribaculum intestinale]|uniref:hypothetical protein n=1 Tax=Paramuribaculum intestinale TaxID=2094151 RepID=UPI0025B6FA7D